MNRSSLRRCSTLEPSNWRFPGESNLDSRNANLNLQIATEAPERPGFLSFHQSGSRMLYGTGFYAIGSF